VMTVAGSTKGFQDGNISDAKFNEPNGVAIDGNGNIFVADLVNCRIRKIRSKIQVPLMWDFTKILFIGQREEGCVFSKLPLDLLKLAIQYCHQKSTIQLKLLKKSQ